MARKGRGRQDDSHPCVPQALLTLLLVHEEWVLGQPAPSLQSSQPHSPCVPLPIIFLPLIAAAEGTRCWITLLTRFLP